MMPAETVEDEIARLKQWHTDVALMRDALQVENAALRSKLNRAHAMICSALAQQTDEMRDTLQRAKRMLA